MTLVQLQYVLTVEEVKSINAAAKILYVAQSSVSGAIKELEEEIGITIYNRSNRGITLTKEGEEFIKYAKNVMMQYKLMMDHYGSKRHETEWAKPSGQLAFPSGDSVPVIGGGYPACRRQKGLLSDSFSDGQRKSGTERLSCGGWNLHPGGSGDHLK